MRLSSSIKPASKAEAFEYLLQLAEEDAKCSHGIDSAKLESVLRYFAPSLPAKAKTAFQWVAKAAAKKDIREALNYVYSDGNYIYGSDGHVAHRAYTDLPVGLYDPKTGIEVDTVGVVYPQIANIFGSFNCEFQDTVIGHQPESIHHDGITRIEFDQPGNGTVPVNKQLFNATCNKEPSLKICVTDGDRIKGKHPFGDFIMMGMRD